MPGDPLGQAGAREGILGDICQRAGGQGAQRVAFADHDTALPLAQRPLAIGLGVLVIRALADEEVHGPALEHVAAVPPAAGHHLHLHVRLLRGEGGDGAGHERDVGIKPGAEHDRPAEATVIGNRGIEGRRAAQEFAPSSTMSAPREVGRISRGGRSNRGRRAAFPDPECCG